MICHVLIEQCSLSRVRRLPFFARGRLHVVTCNSACANQAALSRLRAVIALFARGWSHAVPLTSLCIDFSRVGSELFLLTIITFFALWNYLQSLWLGKLFSVSKVNIVVKTPYFCQYITVNALTIFFLWERFQILKYRISGEIKQYFRSGNLIRDYYLSSWSKVYFPLRMFSDHSWRSHHYIKYHKCTRGLFYDNT